MFTSACTTITSVELTHTGTVDIPKIFLFLSWGITVSFWHKRPVKSSIIISLMLPIFYAYSLFRLLSNCSQTLQKPRSHVNDAITHISYRAGELDSSQHWCKACHLRNQVVAFPSECVPTNSDQIPFRAPPSQREYFQYRRLFVLLLLGNIPPSSMTDNAQFADHHGMPEALD